MIIYFQNNKLQKICSNEKEMQKQLGQAMSKKLKLRLMELKAAVSLAEMSHMPPARCHELIGDRAGQYSVDLEHPFRLLFIPNYDPIPLLADGGVDLSQVTEIVIIDIIDPH